MAQRKGELLKMEMLERLAGLHRDLEQEVEIASKAGGASQSAIAVARDLLSLPAKKLCTVEVGPHCCPAVPSLGSSEALESAQPAPGMSQFWKLWSTVVPYSDSTLPSHTLIAPPPPPHPSADEKRKLPAHARTSWGPGATSPGKKG